MNQLQPSVDLQMSKHFSFVGTFSSNFISVPIHAPKITQSVLLATLAILDN